MIRKVIDCNAVITLDSCTPRGSRSQRADHGDGIRRRHSRAPVMRMLICQPTIEEYVINVDKSKIESS